MTDKTNLPAVQMSSALVGGFEDSWRLARAFQESGYFPTVRSQAQALVKILAGQEMGIGPFQSMSKIHVWNGNIQIGYQLIGRRIKESGRYNYRVTSRDAKHCTITFFERWQEEWQEAGKSTFTMDDAQRMGLAGKDNWRKQPQKMMFARALSSGANEYCPDVFGGPVFSIEADDLTTIEVEKGTAEVLDGPKTARLASRLQERAQEPPEPEEDPNPESTPEATTDANTASPEEVAELHAWLKEVGKWPEISRLKKDHLPDGAELSFKPYQTSLDSEELRLFQEAINSELADATYDTNAESNLMGDPALE